MEEHCVQSSWDNPWGSSLEDFVEYIDISFEHITDNTLQGGEKADTRMRKKQIKGALSNELSL